MKISSPAFSDNGFIPVKYTCDGDNINPQLNIERIPDKTKSLVLIVEDPDAPSGIWTHWILYDIPLNTTRIDENSAPGKQGKNTSNHMAYSGPCPPGKKPHRYFFRLYALDIRLEVPYGVNRPQIDAIILTHVLETAEIMGYYSSVNE
jgi:Raf kinase inhibitor-like YbhB/YbcL family protein